MRFIFIILFVLTVGLLTSCHHEAADASDIAAHEEPLQSTLAMYETIYATAPSKVVEIDKKLQEQESTSSNLREITLDSLTCFTRKNKLVKIVHTERNKKTTFYYDEDSYDRTSYFVHSIEKARPEMATVENSYYFSRDTLIYWLDQHHEPVADTASAYFYTSQYLLHHSQDLFSIWKNHSYNQQHLEYAAMVHHIDSVVAKMKLKEYEVVGDSADAQLKLEEEGFEETIRFYDQQGTLAIYYTGYGGLHGTERIHEYYFKKELVCSIVENTYWQHFFIPGKARSYGTLNCTNTSKIYYQHGNKFRSIRKVDHDMLLAGGLQPLHHSSHPAIEDF